MSEIPDLHKTKAQHYKYGLFKNIMRIALSGKLVWIIIGRLALVICRKVSDFAKSVISSVSIHTT